MATAPEPGAWATQDGQIVARACEDMAGRHHMQWRWDQRVAELDEDLVGYPVRAAWREADIEYRNPTTGTVRRRHDVGMILVSEWAILQTCYIAPDVDREAAHSTDNEFDIAGDDL